MNTNHIFSRTNTFILNSNADWFSVAYPGASPSESGNIDVLKYCATLTSTRRLCFEDEKHEARNGKRTLRYSSTRCLRQACPLLFSKQRSETPFTSTTDSSMIDAESCCYSRTRRTLSLRDARDLFTTAPIRLPRTPHSAATSGASYCK